MCLFHVWTVNMMCQFNGPFSVYLILSPGSMLSVLISILLSKVLQSLGQDAVHIHIHDGKDRLETGRLRHP